MSKEKIKSFCDEFSYPFIVLYGLEQAFLGVVDFFLEEIGNNFFFLQQERTSNTLLRFLFFNFGIYFLVRNKKQVFFDFFPSAPRA